MATRHFVSRSRVLSAALLASAFSACLSLGAAMNWDVHEGQQPLVETVEGLARRALTSLEGGEQNLSSGTKLLYSLLCVLFVSGSGIAAGLTLGLMSLDSLELQVLMRSGTEKEQKNARAILPVLKDPHWLLVTLLLTNAGCFEALPIFLNALINPLGAILISVTLILIFGEILPQAVCVRYGLAIGVAFRWPVRIMMWLTSPISWPLARILDWLLGKEGANVFRRHELKALVDLHGEDEGLGGKLTEDEVQIICGALDLTNKIAYSVMTPLDKVVMLSTEQRIDKDTIHMLLSSGHSRIPVYAGNDRRHIVGLVLVKELLAHAFPGAVGPTEGEVLVSQLNIRQLPRLPANTRCYDMLKVFRTGRAHMMLLLQPDEEPTHEPASAAAAGPSSPPTTHVVTVAPDGFKSQTSNPLFTPTKGANTDSQPSVQLVKTRPAGSSETGSIHLDMTPVADQQSRAPSMLRVAGSGGVSYTLHRNSNGGHSDSEHEAVPALPSRTPTSVGGPLQRLSQRLTSWRIGRKSVDGSLATTSTAATHVTDTVAQVEVPQIELPGEPIGIITIEDVLEELMGVEILDETDHFADNEQTLEVNEDMRIKLAGHLPERLRAVVLGSTATTAVLRRLSRGSGGRQTPTRKGSAQQLTALDNTNVNILPNTTNHATTAIVEGGSTKSGNTKLVK